jgi:hypothetical protein
MAGTLPIAGGRGFPAAAWRRLRTQHVHLREEADDCLREEADDCLREEADGCLREERYGRGEEERQVRGR